MNEWLPGHLCCRVCLESCPAPLFPWRRHASTPTCHRHRLHCCISQVTLLLGGGGRGGSWGSGDKEGEGGYCCVCVNALPTAVPTALPSPCCPWGTPYTRRADGPQLWPGRGPDDRGVAARTDHEGARCAGRRRACPGAGAACLREAAPCLGVHRCRQRPEARQQGSCMHSLPPRLRPTLRQPFHRPVRLALEASVSWSVIIIVR